MDSASVAVVNTLLENGMPKVADAVVEKGVDYVQEKLGVDLHPNLSPEQIERLRLAALKHEEFISELEERSRERATELHKHATQREDPVASRFIYLFAWFWSVVSVAYFFGVTFFTVKNENLANIILGFLLGTAVSAILQFFTARPNPAKTKPC
jgi:hypothetical protein